MKSYRDSRDNAENHVSIMFTNWNSGDSLLICGRRGLALRRLLPWDTFFGARNRYEYFFLWEIVSRAGLPSNR
jgi:hypothetical protein